MYGGGREQVKDIGLTAVTTIRWSIGISPRIANLSSRFLSTGPAV
jgi:hypothetical protein